MGDRKFFVFAGTLVPAGLAVILLAAPEPPAGTLKCCFVDGTCIEMDNDNDSYYTCIAMDGYPVAGQCFEGACTSELGACCQPSDCWVWPESLCNQPGVVWFPGVPCGEADCPPVGALLHSAG